MNFLAHAYLSFNNPQVLAGNMISDFVKGKAKYSFPAGVQLGMHLHRDIDCYTDAHEATKEARKIFSPHYRLYSGPFIDILFDHFLANDTNVFPRDSLQPFTKEVYNTLEAQRAHLPAVFLQVLAIMKTQDWLYQYKYNEGMQRSIRGLVRRATFISDSDTAYNLFLLHYKELQICFDRFFPDVKQFAKERFRQLIT
jgi:acyl carrier protein phosphodiesterase